MRIGVDYYPEHWEESRWPVDAKLMREAGINLVRLAEFSWCKMEPQEGHYDFNWLDRALEVLGNAGIQAVLGTPTATPPAWLHERYPDIYPADPRRYRLGFGTRLQRCLNNPTMRRYAREITQKMAEHFAANPTVIGWQIDNEFEGNLCYCDICAAKFRDWLKAKYITLEALNRAWGTIFWSQEYSGWSQIPLPWEARCGRSHNPSLWLDYRRFASESTVGFAREQTEIIRRLAPGHLITHNFMCYHDSLDYYDLAKEMDLVALDNYPSGFWLNTNDTALAQDVTRGLKQKNFWVMEEQAGIAGWEKMGRRPAPGQIRAWAWQIVAHGADAVIFFRWRSCLYGTEQYWHGILNHDGEPRRRYREIARFGKELASLSSALDGSTVQNQVAILNSYEQNWALQIQPQADGLEWWKQIDRYYQAFLRLGIGVDVPPLTVDLSRYRLVVLPSWYILTPDDANRLAEYVRRGGTLIVNPRTGVKDERNTCRPEPLPSLLREVVGVEVDDYDPLGTAEDRIQFAGESGGEYGVSVWADALISSGAETVATYSRSIFQGEPALTRNRYGEGVAYYCGTYGEPAFYQFFLKTVLAEVDLSGFIDLPEGVDYCKRRKDGMDYLFLVNRTAEPKVCRLPAIFSLVLGEKPDGDRLTLAGYGVGIYKS